MDKKKKIYCLICGSRSFNDYSEFSIIANGILKNYNADSIEIVEGGAKGTDYLAKLYALKNAIPYKEFPANWNKLGKSAGILRNLEMFTYILENQHETEDEIVKAACLIFWDGVSKGTAHDISLAKKNGVMTRVYNFKTHLFMNLNDIDV